MKTIMIGAQTIALAQNNIVLAGGFESMSNAPYYLTKARTGYSLGHGQLVDALLKDGLWDSFDDHHMGMCAEHCAATYTISRQEQDAYALESYRRAQEATHTGRFKEEMAIVQIKDKKGNVIEVDKDEQISKVVRDKVPTLKPVFKKDGTVTAANASAINDGAAALVIADGEWARAQGYKPLARILGWGDHERKPIEFTIAPAFAIPKALSHAGVDAKDVSCYEINEAFSVVALANNRLLKLDPSYVNMNGGAVALGHPIGCSGARIVVTLLHVLKQQNKSIGVAAICNGGGGASAMVVERLS